MEELTTCRNQRLSLRGRIESRRKQGLALVGELEQFEWSPWPTRGSLNQANDHLEPGHTENERGESKRARLETNQADRGPERIVRGMIAACLLAPGVTAPKDSAWMNRTLQKEATPEERQALADAGGKDGPLAAVESSLRFLAGGSDPALEIEDFAVGEQKRIMVLDYDRARLATFLPPGMRLVSRTVNAAGGPQREVRTPSRGSPPPARFGGPWEDRLAGGMVRPPPFLGGPPFMPRPHFGGPPGPVRLPFRPPLPAGPPTVEAGDKDLDALLNKKSVKEVQKSKEGEELLELLYKPTAKASAVASKFKSKGGSALKEYCEFLTKEDCRRNRQSFFACEKVHFRRIIMPHTDVNLGDCSFLDTCRHMKTCKYVHYELDPTPDVPPHPSIVPPALGAPPKKGAEYCSPEELGEPQWINCDIRTFNYPILGKFGVIMADPPWDIHMELPYGTMADDEMRNLNVPVLQDDGLIFLWVTGRAMELGRECLELWGYKRVEELIWVKTNQLQRIIRTGRTGHWLNHSKEHCLVGIKGNPVLNRNIDCDVLVAEVRETSRKPDEMYPLLERLSPRTRKIELFARPHNAHAGWMSLGNQLDGVRIVDEGLRQRFRASYPGVEIQPADKETSDPLSLLLTNRKERPGTPAEGVSGSIGSSAGFTAKGIVAEERSMQST